MRKTKTRERKEGMGVEKREKWEKKRERKDGEN